MRGVRCASFEVEVFRRVDVVQHGVPAGVRVRVGLVTRKTEYYERGTTVQGLCVCVFACHVRVLCADEGTGEDDGVEGDVVLAHKLDQLHLTMTTGSGGQRRR